MATFCVCGRELKKDPSGIRVNRRPCLCPEDMKGVAASPRGLSFMRGRVVRDPKRAALGLPDLTPIEKSVLKGTIHEY